MRTIVIIALGLVFLTNSNSFSKDAPRTNSLDETLAAVPTAELPAKAADLVALAKSRDRQFTTINVVKTAVGINPAAAPYIVSAIARAVPDMAPAGAGAAAAAQPKLAGAIAKAAAAAAPSQAGKVVVALCRAVPDNYRNVVVAVVEAVPGSADGISKAVGAALPELKASIDQILAGYGRKVASAPGPLPPITRSSAPRPPYFPLTVTPTNGTFIFSGEASTGGRNYATP